MSAVWSPAAPAEKSAANQPAFFRRCRIENRPADWPAIEVLAIRHQVDPAGAAGHDRMAARRLLRAALQRQAGATFANRWLDLPPERRGAGPVSISHEAGVSLLAWCPAGAVGIDVVGLASLVSAERPELLANAELYLGPQAASDVAGATDASEARRRFAGRWADMEARCKCLGLALDEWTAQRGRHLASIQTAGILVSVTDLRWRTNWIAKIAWSDNTRLPHPAC